MATPTSKALKDYLDSVPWTILFDAYGSARPLKSHLLALYEGDQEAKKVAVYDGIWSHAIHQGNYYTCTIFTVRPIVMVLRDAVPLERAVLFNCLNFLSRCVQIGSYKLRWRLSILPISPVRLLQLPFLLKVGLPSLEEEIPKAQAIYEQLVEDVDPKIRNEARKLLEFCKQTT